MKLFRCLFLHKWKYYTKTWTTILPKRPDVGEVSVTLHFRECEKCCKFQSSRDWKFKRVWRDDKRRELLTAERIKMVELAHYSIMH